MKNIDLLSRVKRRAAVALAAALCALAPAAHADPFNFAFTFGEQGNGTQGGDAQWDGYALGTGGTASANGVMNGLVYGSGFTPIYGAEGQYVNFIGDQGVVSMNLMNSDGTLASVIDTGGSFFNLGGMGENAYSFIYQSSQGFGSYWTTNPYGVLSSQGWNVTEGSPTLALMQTTFYNGFSLVGGTVASVPEIDGAQLPVAIFVLGTGIMLIVANRRRHAAGEHGMHALRLA